MLCKPYTLLANRNRKNDMPTKRSTLLNPEPTLTTQPEQQV